MILELMGPREREATSWLLNQAKLDLGIELVAGVEALVLPADVVPSRSHGAALQWVLAVQSIHRSTMLAA